MSWDEYILGGGPDPWEDGFSDLPRPYRKASRWTEQEIEIFRLKKEKERLEEELAEKQRRDDWRNDVKHGWAEED
jgi:hypothetical protein